MPVNVAFIGETKSGKSTVINSLRNEGTAGVCTLEPNPYPHRQNNYIVLWNIPGLNVPGENSKSRSRIKIY